VAEHTDMVFFFLVSRRNHPSCMHVCYCNTARNILSNSVPSLINNRTRYNWNIIYCFPGTLDGYVVMLVHNTSLKLYTTRIMYHSDHTSPKKQAIVEQFLGLKRVSKQGRSFIKNIEIKNVRFLENRLHYSRYPK